MNRRVILASTMVVPVLTVPAIPHAGLLPGTVDFIRLASQPLQPGVWRTMWGRVTSPNRDHVVDELLSLGYVEKVGPPRMAYGHKKDCFIQDFVLTEKFKEDFIT